MQRINRQVTNGGKINSAYGYTYNDLGHITKTVNQYGWRKPSVVQESYSYDGLHRLSGFSLYPLQNNGGTVKETWNYDPAGNRLSWAANDDLQTNTPFDGFSRTYEYNEANQMLGMTHDAGKKSKNYAYGYSYDENGNRINRQLADASGPQYGVDYSYDPENRLIEALDYQLTGKNGKNRIDRAVTSLEYDGGGRRLVQHYDPKNGGGGVDKRDEYVFDGLDPVAEYDKLNGQRTDYYRGEGGNIALMHQYKGGTQGQMYWYHYNNKKDVAGLTKQNGNSHHNYRYEPYGAVLPENGNFTDPHNHYTLTGKEFDENTGLVWFGARHYEPETGVWMGQDVYRGRLSEPGSLHRFGYVYNNPVNYYDFLGFDAALIVTANEFHAGDKVWHQLSTREDDQDAYHKKGEALQKELFYEEIRRFLDGEEERFSDGVYHLKASSPDDVISIMKYFEKNNIKISYFEFYGHGDKNGIYFDYGQEQENGEKRVKSLLMNNQSIDYYRDGTRDYHVKDIPSSVFSINAKILLNSCNTGDSNGIASELASHLNSIVEAPNTTVNFDGYKAYIDGYKGLFGGAWKLYRPND
ncbi:RHS repeat domain-containing protein [Candidatus Electronema sp. JC]|uniref:RHS repeat domain-containing protein n=1 Tax=Candidatus Electronema sp. JC TaxID=3401570 RepID=UPI003B42D500